MILNFWKDKINQEKYINIREDNNCQYVYIHMVDWMEFKCVNKCPLDTYQKDLFAITNLEITYAINKSNPYGTLDIARLI